MATRLVVCFDGTWERPDDTGQPNDRVESNVRRFYESVITGDVGNGHQQMKWYDQGVGTRWYDRIVGGAFGFGLDQNIRQGYAWLSSAYATATDPEIYILGFSRGAYTARSLVGLIRNCGLLRRENIQRAREAYEIYRHRKIGVDDDKAIGFRTRYAHPDVAIHFLGVWDTVGALGIPLHALQWLNEAEYAFHDTQLSGIVRNAFHAMAIDEHRAEYDVTAWHPIKKPGQQIEQRWFVGAHADIGGGYAERALSDITLAWMQDRAQVAVDATGKPSPLVLSNDPYCRPAVGDANIDGPIHDSYKEFLHGHYARVHQRFHRTLALGDDQRLHESVTLRCRRTPGYRPLNAGFAPQDDDGQAPAPPA